MKARKGSDLSTRSNQQAGGQVVIKAALTAKSDYPEYSASQSTNEAGSSANNQAMGAFMRIRETNEPEHPQRTQNVHHLQKVNDTINSLSNNDGGRVILESKASVFEMA